MVDLPFPRSGFTQIFQTILHRDHDLLSFHTRTHQLQPDGEVRQLMREPLPPELQEKVRLGGVQHRPGIPYRRTPQGDSYRRFLHRVGAEPLSRGCQAPHPQHGNGPTNIINVRKNTELELKSGNFQRTIVLWRKIRRLIIKILTNY